MSADEVKSTPYSGTPISIPGLIEAEFFDKGGQALAYYDDSPTNKGNVSAPTAGIVDAWVNPEPWWRTRRWSSPGDNACLHSDRTGTVRPAPSNEAKR